MMDYAKAAGWLGGFLIFIMFIAGMSRLLTMNETGKTIRGFSAAIANLFRGVLD
jgi:uncharacterized membrane protein YkgB